MIGFRLTQSGMFWTVREPIPSSLYAAPAVRQIRGLKEWPSADTRGPISSVPLRSGFVRGTVVAQFPGVTQKPVELFRQADQQPHCTRGEIIYDAFLRLENCGEVLSVLVSVKRIGDVGEFPHLIHYEVAEILGKSPGIVNP